MMADVTRLRPWHFAVGGALMMAISLYDVARVVSERWDRAEVLAHGREAQARVVRSNGAEAVQIEWTDDGGRIQTAESKTGKVFARAGVGSTVQIKYDPISRRAPVIIAEAAERERLDGFALQSSLMVAAGIAAAAGAAAFSVWRIRRKRANGAASD